MVDTQLLGIGSRVKHPAFGPGVVIRLRAVAYEICFMQHGIKEVGKNYANLEVIEHIAPEETVSFTEAEKSLVRILKAWSDITEVVPLGDRWKGGTLVIKSADENIKHKEIPIETFFHKITMVRDRLRVMEQRVNSSKNLEEEEKINLQQYITRIYGSLTTFNVLFKEKDDQFVGEKSN